MVFNLQHIVYNIYTAIIIMMPFYMENFFINRIKKIILLFYFIHVQFTVYIYLSSSLLSLVRSSVIESL